MAFNTQNNLTDYYQNKKSRPMYLKEVRSYLLPHAYSRRSKKTAMLDLQKKTQLQDQSQKK
jgi:DNA recombination-dependent growth factor C